MFNIHFVALFKYRDFRLSPAASHYLRTYLLILIIFPFIQFSTFMFPYGEGKSQKKKKKITKKNRGNKIIPCFSFPAFLYYLRLNLDICTCEHHLPLRNLYALIKIGLKVALRFLFGKRSHGDVNKSVKFKYGRHLNLI